MNRLRPNSPWRRSEVMKVRAQIGMVLNLDKCIGCHTCSVTCKNVWTNREGMEYAWFNNVETKPGIGYPKQWENQEKWNGGWVRKDNGKIQPKQGGKLEVLLKIFANPNLPQIDDYYEPFTYDYQHLHNAPEMKAPPTARPRSLLTGARMEKIEWGPNWEEILGGEFAKRSKDANFEDMQKEMYGQFENTFMMYLPRLCEHCLNPTCVASCPSGSIYKREEDGIVLIDQDKCRGWRMCVSGCPYKKIYYNWSTGKAEKCIFCYPRIESGQPTVCAETCVGRIRYLGVMLYDADRIAEAASVESEKDLYKAQLGVFLDPHAAEVQAQARADGVPEAWIQAAQASPVYKMAMEWKVALPLHPEYRTLPMVWYVPPLSPISAAANAGQLGAFGALPDVRSLRGRRGAGGGGARAHARDAGLYARPACGAARERGGAEAGGLEQGRGRRNVPLHGDRQLRGPLRHPDYAPRIRGKRLRPARRLRILLRQRLLGRPVRSEPVRRQEAQDHPDQVPVLGDDLMKTLKLLAVLLSYPSEDLVAALPEIARRLGAEPRLRGATQDALAGLLAELKREDLLDLQ
jgi:nitrate reductase beta subunit